MSRRRTGTSTQVDVPVMLSIYYQTTCLEVGIVAWIVRFSIGIAKEYKAALRGPHSKGSAAETQ